MALEANSVTANDDLGKLAFAADSLEHARHALAAQRRFHLHRQTRPDSFEKFMTVSQPALISVTARLVI
jgi:hypothetical protein